MALSDEILAKVKAKGGGGGPPPEKGPPMAEEPAGDEYAGDEETAMQEFMDAETPAEKVTALKSFMAICYPSLGGE